MSVPRLELSYSLRGDEVTIKIYRINRAEYDVGIMGPWSDDWSVTDEKGNVIELTETEFAAINDHINEALSDY